MCFQAAPNGLEDTEALTRLCLEKTGFDASVYDKPGTGGPSGRASMSTTARATRKDSLAIVRMQNSGITEADLEYERKVGYQNG